MLCKQKRFNMNYLDLARKCDCLEFTATQSVQSVNNQIWYNKFSTQKELVGSHNDNCMI